MKAVWTDSGLVAGDGIVRAGGPSDANPHNASAWLAAMKRQHRGTRFGRQELGGEMFADLEGALWTRALIEKRRLREDGTFPHEGDTEGDSHFQARRWEAISAARESDCPLDGLWPIMVGVDPPASVEGICGIVVCGADDHGNCYVLADLSAGGLSPEGWARRVASAAEDWNAQKVVAEANNGGAMVAAVLRGAGLDLKVRLVHAAEGKAARAAPVATLFESEHTWFAGRFPELEEQLCGLTWDGHYHGPGRSPDRADAMVWALTELMLERRGGRPRIRML